MGQIGITTMRKTRVKAERSSVRAISFGLLWRMAPSTRAIIRSRNDAPAPLVIRATMRSERTTVPPVTPDRSPPAALMTGADSPVMADSSTEATPSMISPSPGIVCPCFHDDHVSRLEHCRRDFLDNARSVQAKGCRVVARFPERLRLGLAACFREGGRKVREDDREEKPCVEGDEIA